MFRKCSEGVSLLLALILIGILVLFALLITNVVFGSIREAANMQRANQAFYAAEGGLEAGLLLNAKKGITFSTAGAQEVVYPTSADCSANDPGCSFQVDTHFVVQGQVLPDIKINNSYVVPAVGTGTAGEACDALKAVTQGSFAYNGIQYNDPFDHPCNWNKIKVGESAAIPLYYQDQNGMKVNILKNQSSSIQLKIRTACPDGKIMCSSAERPDLDYASGDPNFSGNDPVVFWQIVGKDQATGETYTLDPELKFQAPKVLDQYATLISEKKIVLAKFILNYVVLDQNDIGIDKFECKGSILDFLLNADPMPACAAMPWSGQQIIEPVFKLRVINSLKDILGTTVPYLEYQLVIDTTAPPADTVQTITSESFVESFKQVLQVKAPQASGLLEYVIQQ